jgi:hypothetical protein
MAPNVPRAISRNGLNSSRLVRLLAEMASADPVSVAASKQSFAEKLGLWLDWPDAIALAAALTRDPAAGSLMHRSAGDAVATGAVEAFFRVRAELANAIADDGVFNTGRPLAKRPPPASGAARRGPPQPLPSPAPEPSAGPLPDHDFSPYRRAYVSHQRAMAAAIGPLRSRVRAGLSSLNPALGQLAALDAVLDDALAARERHLLARVPGLLEKHFARGCKAPQVPTADGLAGVCQDMQGVLLAELDIRLQPIAGLLEAMGYEVTGQS